MPTLKRPLIIMETKLRDVPEAWLKYIEPRIRREGMCWLWEGAINTDGEPVLNYDNAVTGKRNTRLVKWIIAEMFWEMRRGLEVIHHCGTDLCLNPSHFYISAKHYSQEDRDRMKQRKKNSIQKYLKHLTAENKSDQY